MRLEDGVSLLKEACEVALREDHIGTTMRRLIAAADEGEIDAAVQTADAILRVNPRCADAAVVAAVLLAGERSQRPRALRYFEQALSREPDNGLVSWWLATDAMCTGRTPAALAFLDGAVKNEPADLYVALTLIWLLELLGRTQEVSSVVSTLLGARQADRAWLALTRLVLPHHQTRSYSTPRGPSSGILQCLLEVAGLWNGRRTASATGGVPMDPCGVARAQGRSAAEQAPLLHRANPAIGAYTARYGHAVVERYTDAFVRTILGQDWEALPSRGRPAHPPQAAPEIEVPPDTVLVQAGTYTVGYGTNTSGHPERKVSLLAFLIDRYPVTNRQWQEFQPTHVFPTGQEDHPVANVDFVQATMYARWKGKRLPTEVEWEAAARGLDGRRYPWGNDPDPRKANCAEQSSKSTTPVTRYPQGAAPCGARDMMGNAQEWVDTSGPVRNGQSGIRVAKGGGFGARSAALTCWHRCLYQPLLKAPNLGFRCAKDVPRDAASL